MLTTFASATGSAGMETNRPRSALFAATRVIACIGAAAWLGCSPPDSTADEHADDFSRSQSALHVPKHPAPDDDDDDGPRGLRRVPEPLAPEDGATLTTPRPVFRWGLEHDKDSAIVQICSSASCRHVIQTFTARSGTGSPARDLAPGTYYWRVAFVHGHAFIYAWSDIQRFYLVPSGPPVTSKDLLGVWSVSATNVWAVGADGTILHYDGTWTADLSPTTQRLESVWAAGDGTAWAVGSAGTIVRRSGGSWAASASSITTDLRGVWASGSNDAWAVGDLGRILHWNGAAWSVHHDRLAGTLHAVWGSGPSDVWVVGAGREPDNDYAALILHWDGTSWSESYVCNPEGTRFAAGGYVAVLDDVWGVAGGGPWAAGSCHPGGGFVPRAFVVRRDGGTWIEPPGPPSEIAEFRPLGAIWGSSASDVWVASFNLADAVHVPTMMHFNGVGWTASSQAITVGIHDLGGTAASDVWAVGVGGKRLHYNGVSWSASP